MINYRGILSESALIIRLTGESAGWRNFFGHENSKFQGDAAAENGGEREGANAVATAE